MRIIGISGSPRKGNTEWMLSTLLAAATAAALMLNCCSLAPPTSNHAALSACEKRNSDGCGTLPRLTMTCAVSCRNAGG